MDMSTTAALCIALLVSLVSYIVSSSIILLSFKPSNTSKIGKGKLWIYYSVLWISESSRPSVRCMWEWRGTSLLRWCATHHGLHSRSTLHMWYQVQVSAEAIWVNSGDSTQWRIPPLHSKQRRQQWYIQQRPWGISGTTKPFHYH